MNGGLGDCAQQCPGEGSRWGLTQGKGLSKFGMLRAMHGCHFRDQIHQMAVLPIVSTDCVCNVTSSDHPTARIIFHDAVGYSVF